ncbi:hypothetical protein TWF694_004294 [Orbilia ellipsospora]|uniref:Uncharacterized protein n=1 Tax=Orbilia ellipsospora TaxID=2528407 RepID=A0AAV9WYU5_9PEZI
MWFYGNGSSIFSSFVFTSVVFLILSPENVAKAQPEEYKEQWGIVLERTLDAYISNNTRSVRKCRQILADLSRGAYGNYPLGWSSLSRIMRQMGQGEESEEAFEEGREAWEVVPPMSLLDINDALHAELIRLRKVVQDVIDGKEKPPEEVEPDPYENPFAHTIQYYEEQALVGPKGKLLPTEPLQIYTNLAGKEAIVRIDELFAFNDNLIPQRTNLREGFFWFYGRPGPILKMSVLGLLSDFVDSMSRGGEWNDWFWGIREFVMWLWVIPDEVRITDTSQTSNSDISYDSDIEYETVLPERRDYRIDGKEAFLSGLRELFEALSTLISDYEELVVNTFKPPLIKSHPEVSIAYDLARQQFRIMMFFYETITKLLEAVEEMPPLISKWVEPTKVQVVYAYKNGILKKFGRFAEDIDEEYFANFQQHLNAPSTNVLPLVETQEEEEGTRVSTMSTIILPHPRINR